jgi:hypothetical protein
MSISVKVITSLIAAMFLTMGILASCNYNAPGARGFGNRVAGKVAGRPGAFRPVRRR